MDILTLTESALGHSPQFDQAQSELVDSEGTYARRSKPKESCRSRQEIRKCRPAAKTFGLRIIVSDLTDHNRLVLPLADCDFAF